jgi:hypothetical protein
MSRRYLVRGCSTPVFSTHVERRVPKYRHKLSEVVSDGGHVIAGIRMRAVPKSPHICDHDCKVWSQVGQDLSPIVASLGNLFTLVMIRKRDLRHVEAVEQDHCLQYRSANAPRSPVSDAHASQAFLRGRQF